MKNRDQIQKEALEALSKVDRAGVAITMGGGKTLVGLRHMEKNLTSKSKYLVVAPKLSIQEEWLNQADQFGLSHIKEHITLSTYLSLPKQELDYDIVYLDECHSLLNTHESWLDQYKGKIVGLTGTPPKYGASEKGKLVDKFCPMIYRYEVDEAVEDKILNDYRIIIHTLDLDEQKNIKMEKKGKVWYASEKSTYDYWTGRLRDATSKKEEQIMRVMRMKSMMTFPSKERLAKDLIRNITSKVIVFANTQDQADSFNVPSYHSNNPDSEENLTKFKQGKISALAAVLQLNEGVNIPNLKEGIIMHAYGNERKSSQRIGRLLRLNPKETSTIHILCYKDTIDEKWVNDALESFDQSKIKWLIN